MKIAIGTDHGGFELKEYLKKELSSKDEIIDEGCFSKESVDYPVYAKKVANDIESGKAELGILICTNGIGMSIAANKFNGIRAALVLSDDMAMHAKAHNDANVICLGGDNQSKEAALNYAKLFIDTPFSNVERHERRVNEIKSFEEEK